MIFLGGAPVVGFGIANPASENCVSKGGIVQILETRTGQSGICVFPDGSQCEEWALFRGQCTRPEAEPFADIVPAAEAAALKVGLAVGATVAAVGLTWHVLSRKKKRR